MQKNYLDSKIFRFSKYLNEIGILSRFNTEKFEKFFYEISSALYNNEYTTSNGINISSIVIKKCLISALITFIQSLSEEEQQKLALDIYEKYNKNEKRIEEKLIKIFDIYSKYKIKSYFTKWKSEIFVLTNSLKKVISSNILSTIQNSFAPTLIKNVNEKNVKVNANNSMLNINPQLNISTNPDIYNNYSFHDVNYETNINYTYENKNKRKNNSDSNRTYSLNFYNQKNNYINNNYHNDSYNYIQNYLNKSNNDSSIIPLSKDHYRANNSALLNNNYINNISTFKSKKKKVNLDYINNLCKAKTEHNLIPEKTSKYIKEQQELKNFCTFKPKINKSSSFSRYWNSSNKGSIDRLYLDSKNRIARKEFESLKKNKLESKENTFQPKFVSSSVKRVKSDFDKRLKEFEINKKNKIKKISEDLEEEQKEEFTFAPKINDFNYYNNTTNNNKRVFSNNFTVSNISKNSTINNSMINNRNKLSKKIPVYKRLYNDNKNKMIKKQQREKEELEKIKKNSSKISEGNNGNNTNILDKKKIEELYNDYKSKKKRLKLKQEEIEKEQGITFQPELISNKNYYNKINPDFYEREKLFLEKQQKNIETYKEYLEREQNPKKFSYTEKREIYDNIVNRLYKDGMEKYREKQGKIYNKNYSDVMN